MRAVIVIVLLAILAITLATSPVRKPRGEGFSRRRHLSSSRPRRGEKPSKAEKPRSRKPRSRKPKSDEKPRARKPLKEKIAGLEKKLAALKKRLADKKAKKADKPRSKSPKSRKPRSRKPKSDKPAASRKPRSRKPKSRSPKSRKPKSDKPAKTLADATFWKNIMNLLRRRKQKQPKQEEQPAPAPAENPESDFLFKRKRRNKKQPEQPAPAPAPEVHHPAPEVAAPAPAEEAPQADSETVSCGQAYDHGKALGEKQCVLVQGKPVVVETANAFAKMEAAAKAAGITLQVNSGFRKMSEQEHLYNCYLTKKCNNGNLAARPGYSNHQNGKAMDIAVANPAVFTWMRNNASKFGFVRTVPSENWHWELRNTKCNAFVSYTCQ